MIVSSVVIVVTFITSIIVILTGNKISNKVASIDGGNSLFIFLQSVATKHIIKLQGKQHAYAICILHL